MAHRQLPQYVTNLPPHADKNHLPKKKVVFHYIVRL